MSSSSFGVCSIQIAAELCKDQTGHEVQANESGEAAVIPITVRQLEAIVRLSEALARMTLSHVANDNHVLEAIRLFNNTTVDAARSGINQLINLTPELANEIKHSETHITRRMGIGSHISERRLIDELSRMGLNESIVRRAILIMHQGCAPAAGQSTIVVSCLLKDAEKECLLI